MLLVKLAFKLFIGVRNDHWSAWIRAHIACLLVFLLATSGLAQQPSNKPLSNFDSGTAVKIRTISGRKLAGTNDRGEIKLLYSEIRSVEAVNLKKGGPKTTWIVIGFVAAVAVVVMAVFAKRLNNEGFFN